MVMMKVNGSSCVSHGTLQNTFILVVAQSAGRQELNCLQVGSGSRLWGGDYCAGASLGSALGIVTSARDGTGKKQD